MNRIFAAILLLMTISCNTEVNDQHEIDADVWKPLRKSLQDDDARLHTSFYSILKGRMERKDLVLHKYECYPERVSSGLKADISSRIKFDVDIRFLSRISLKDRAYEIGYYKCTFTFPDGKQVISYSKFQATLTKEDGQWNILSDSILPVTLTEEDFLRATPVE